MTNRITGNRYVTVLAVVALAIGCFPLGTGWLQPAKARTQSNGDSAVDLTVFVYSSRPIGIIPGQMLRITVGNTAESPGSRIVQRGGRYSWAYQVINRSNVPLFTSERIPVPPGEFRYADVSRRDLNIEGEPGTGRAQVLVRVAIEAPRGSEPEDFPVALEVINEDMGETDVHVIVIKLRLKQGFPATTGDFDGTR